MKALKLVVLSISKVIGFFQYLIYVERKQQVREFSPVPSYLDERGPTHQASRTTTQTPTKSYTSLQNTKDEVLHPKPASNKIRLAACGHFPPSFFPTSHPRQTCSSRLRASKKYLIQSQAQARRLFTPTHRRGADVFGSPSLTPKKKCACFFALRHYVDKARVKDTRFVGDDLPSISRGLPFSLITPAGNVLVVTQYPIPAGPRVRTLISSASMVRRCSGSGGGQGSLSAAPIITTFPLLNQEASLSSGRAHLSMPRARFHPPTPPMHPPHIPTRASDTCLVPDGGA